MKHLHNRIDRNILKEQLRESKVIRKTLSFYKYANIRNVSFFRDHLYYQLNQLGVLGRIYVAAEGVNAQISVPEMNFESFKSTLDDIDFLNNCRLNIAIEEKGNSFYKLTIKIKAKIVADGLDDDTFDVTNKGIHLDAKSFNELSQEENTVIIDMRNHYESEIGHFENAICPDVETFKDSLPIVEEILSDKKEANIIMYCTGGIRCEKASAYYKHRGFKNVYQLEGGIIEYARQVNQQDLENMFKGKNFVFDDRLGERISKDIISKCHQCGKPCDSHTNCLNDACHILFIQCESCQKKYHACCSIKCHEFLALSEEERERMKPKVEFNGTKFGKGRYKALHRDDNLTVD